MKKIIGFFGGSFDPIHFGHIHLALELSEKYQLDEVLFCPAFCSPFKSHFTPNASPDDRLAMVRLAIEEIPLFKVTSIELDRKGPSFTIDTLKALASEKVQFRLLLSEESAAHLDQWKDYHELILLAPPLIGRRSKEDSPSQGITQMKVLEISSTEVRQRLEKGLYCGHLVPAKVLAYIQLHGLYNASNS